MCEQKRTRNHPFELPVRLPPVPMLTEPPGNRSSGVFLVSAYFIADQREIFL